MNNYDFQLNKVFILHFSFFIFHFSFELPIFVPSQKNK
jgi:hypothetical protein